MPRKSSPTTSRSSFACRRTPRPSASPRPRSSSACARPCSSRNSIWARPLLAEARDMSMYLVVGLVRDAERMRDVVRALADAAFEREEIDMLEGPVIGLVARGVPEREAHVLAEGVRRGGAIVAVQADDQMEAEQAALL